MTEFLNCRQCVDLLADYLEGKLTPEQQEQLQEHFSACTPCVNFLNTYKDTAQLTQRLRSEQLEVPDEVQTRLKSFLRDSLGASHEH